MLSLKSISKEGRTVIVQLCCYLPTMHMSREYGERGGIMVRETTLLMGIMCE